MKKLIYLFLLITVSASADDSIIFCDGRRATDCRNTPGCYFDGQGSNGRCKLCPPGYYCNGGNKTECDVFEDCPPGSSVGIASGSAKKPGWYRKLDTLESARCPRGYYCPEGSYVPLKCPNGTSSCKGSSKDLHCTSSLETLKNCPEPDGGIGYMVLSLGDLCAQKVDASSCGETQGCVWKVEVTDEECTTCNYFTCKPDYGYTWDSKWGTCTDNNGVTIKQCCKVNTSCAVSDTGLGAAGAEGLCPEGDICLGDAMATCQCKLPDDIEAVVGTTGLGAKDIDDCIVTCDYFTTKDSCYTAKGCYWNGSQCKYCEAGYFCDGQIKEPRKCPYGSTSYPGSVSITECYIEEISVSSFDDNYKLGGPYYFNGYNTAQFFTVGNTMQFPIDMAGSVCK